MESVATPTDPLRVEYACTRAETSEAESLQLRQRLGGGSRGRMWIVLIAILSGLAAVFYFQIAASERMTWIIVFLVVWPITFACMRLKPKAATQSLAVEITIRGVRVLKSNQDMMIYWLDFSKLLESDRLFVLMGRKDGFTLTLPKRVFPDTPAQEFFRTVAKAEIGRCAALRKSGLNQASHD
jgi:hypothetical protein